MARSTIKPRGSKRSRRPLRLKKLPVPVSSLRWALVRRLVFAVPVGWLLGGMLINAYHVDGSASGFAAAMLGGMGLSFALFLAIIWLLGRSRRAAFAAGGGDPNAAGVLLFGAMAPLTHESGSGGHHGDGGFSWGWGGDSGGDGGGGGDGGD